MSASVDALRAARNEAAVAAPGTITVGGRTFVLSPSSIEDAAAWHAAARGMIQAEMGDPLETLNRKLNALQARSLIPGGEPINPLLVKALAAEAFPAASAAKGDGKAEPTHEQIVAKCLSLEGFVWYTHYRLAKADPGVTREWVAAHVTADNWGDVSRQFAALDRAEKLLPN